MAQHNDFGAQGEDIAIDYLRRKGYVILDRNWRSGHREIDIEEAAAFMAKQAKKEKIGTFDAEDVRWIVDGELEFWETQE